LWLARWRFVAYKARGISDAGAHELMIRALDATALPVTRIPAAMAKWRNPRPSEFAAGGRTGWRLFNAVTEALKEGSYMDLPRRTQALHGLMDLACGLAAPEVLPIPPAEPQLAQAV
jgi:hypothetical protein